MFNTANQVDGIHETVERLRYVHGRIYDYMNPVNEYFLQGHSTWQPSLKF